MSVFSHLREKMVGSMVNKQTQAFKEHFTNHINTLSNLPVFNFPVFVEQMREQAKKGGVMGWKSFLPNAPTEKAPEAKEIKAVLQLCDEALKQGIANIEQATFQDKLKLSKAAQQDVGDVNVLLRKYLSAKAMHDWVQRRKSAGLPLPESQEDMMTMLKETPMKLPPEVTKFAKKTQKQSMKEFAKARYGK
jgi:hypothetical protein